MKTTVASQTAPHMGTQPTNHVVRTEHPPGNQTGNEPVPFLNCSKNCPTDIQSAEQHVTTTLTNCTTIPPLTTKSPLIEEVFARDEQTNEVYLPLTSTVVLKRKQEMLYVPQDFENNLTVDALVNSRAFVSAIVYNDLGTIKEKAPKNILKIDDPLIFQIQVGNGQLEKPLATATPKLENGDNIFAEHFVLMKKLTGPVIGLHFMRINSVVIDTTHGLTHFPHLQCRLKRPQVKQLQNRSQTSLTMPWLYHRRQQRESQPSSTIRQTSRDTIGEVYGNSKFADVPPKVDKN